MTATAAIESSMITIPAASVTSFSRDMPCRLGRRLLDGRYGAVEGTTA